MGEWVKVVKPPHEDGSDYCNKPYPKKDMYAVGSIWVCTCGVAYEITKWNNSQFDGDYPTWTVVPNYNSR